MGGTCLLEAGPPAVSKAPCSPPLGVPLAAGAATILHGPRSRHAARVCWAHGRLAHSRREAPTVKILAVRVESVRTHQGAAVCRVEPC